MGGVAVNAVPIVGQPVAYGTGFIALVVVGLSPVVARYFYVLAHEGGHMLAATFLFRGLNGYELNDHGGGHTEYPDRGFLLRQPVMTFSGFAAPPLLGLGGAALIVRENPFAVLFVAGLLSALALFVAANGLARLIPTLVIAAIFAAALRGSVETQAALAVGVVWFLLIAGLVHTLSLPVGVGDPEALRRRLLLPGSFWKLVWIVIAVVSLVAGARMLLVPGA